MPTGENFQELIDYCDWELVNLNGVYGYIVSSKKNCNSIFIRAYTAEFLEPEYFDTYLTSKVNVSTNNPDTFESVFFTAKETDKYVWSASNYLKLPGPVRPVLKK